MSYLVIETIPNQHVGYSVVGEVDAASPEEAVLSLNRLGQFRAIDLVEVAEIAVSPAIAKTSKVESDKEQEEKA